MASNVNSAFREFLTNTVNIPKTQSDNAKRSRNFLIEQINNIGKSNSFVNVASQYNCYFGSFSRKTKICELDDIDIIIGLNGNGLEIVGNEWDNITLKVKDTNNKILIGLSDKFSGYYEPDKYYLNSNQIKNRLVSGLKNVDQYENAIIHARGEAVTLKLKSYSWNFDIVPAFYYGGDKYSKPYYLIPNGFGKWKKTNPKIEQDRISTLNQKFNGVVLETVRLVKYWNRRGMMPNITSYVLETMVLDYFDQARHNVSNSDGDYDYPDMHFMQALQYIGSHIYYNVQDSKGIQGNINNLSYDQKTKISTRANSDYIKAKNAVNAEISEKNAKKSIQIWRDLFGEDFPKYE